MRERFLKDVIQDVAQAVLQKHNITAPPVDIKRILVKEGICVHYHNIESISYTVVFRNKRSGRFYIAVNGSVDELTERFNLGLGFAHIVLEHFDKYGAETVCAPPKGSSINSLLIHEAEIFACELFASKPWMDDILGKKPLTDEAILNASRILGIPPSRIVCHLARSGRPIHLAAFAQILSTVG